MKGIILDEGTDDQIGKCPSCFWLLEYPWSKCPKCRVVLEWDKWNQVTK